MRYLSEPYYKKEITGALKRFDDRNTGFSRGVHEGGKYQLVFQRSLRAVEDPRPGKTVIDFATRTAAKTVDNLLRKSTLAREGAPVHNREFKLKNPDPAAMAKIVKETAQWFGADLVGIADLNPLWIYSHWGAHNAMYTNATKEGDPIEIPADYTKVIVMAHEMEYELIQRSPDPEPSTAMGYSTMAWCVSSLAAFIREMGYHAIPCGNELGPSIPMAIDAGLGEASRMGLLITRKFGPRVRISKVFTDLPLAVDAPIDIGVQRFCEACKRCAKVCPSRAIPRGPKSDKAVDQSNIEGIRKWQVNAMSCLNWWVQNSGGCSVCIRVCPWNKPNTVFHRAVRVLAERGLFSGFLTYMDEKVGYGRHVKKKQYNHFQDPSVVRI